MEMSILAIAAGLVFATACPTPPQVHGAIILGDEGGLDVPCSQAKRSERRRSPPVQALAGSIDGHCARTGGFITTSTFGSVAREYVTNFEEEFVLLGGTTLAQPIIDHDVWGAPMRTFIVRRMDADYFAGK